MDREPKAPSAQKGQTKGEKKGEGLAGAEVAGPIWDASPIQLKRAAENPFSAPRASVLGLQRTIGNRATSRLLSEARRSRSGSTGVVQAKAEGAAALSTAPRTTNSTGLPDNVKTGLEGLSGHSLDDVKVHYNSDAPARIQAKAFTKGTDIHVAPGQEEHVAHEGWHVVQQKQGRVRPTLQLKGESLNDDSALEREADEMGARALRFTGGSEGPLEQRSISGGVIQGKVNTSSLKAFIGEQVALQEERKAARNELLSVDEDAEEDDGAQESSDDDLMEELDEEAQTESVQSSIRIGHFAPALDNKHYTTVGYEHEFGEMLDGPLKGVTHLELAESSLKMPYTGIPFFIETDASNAIELVSPPFLIETLPDSPIPDADDVDAIDQLFKRSLVAIAQGAGNISGMIHLFEADAGLHFEMPDTLQIGRKNVTQNTGMDIYNSKLSLGKLGSDKTQVSKLDVMKIKVSTTNKCGDLTSDYHVQTHVNFASDAETYDDLQEQYAVGSGLFRATFSSIEGRLRDLLLGSAFADEAASQQNGRDAMRSSIAAVGRNIVPLAREVAMAIASGRKSPSNAPLWAKRNTGKWQESTTSGAERVASSVATAFAEIDHALENPHISPFQRDSLVARLRAAVDDAVKMIRSVRKTVNNDGREFPANIMTALTAAQGQAALTASSLTQMALITDGKDNLRVFFNTLARQLSGQMAVDAIAAVKAAQEKRYGSSFKWNKFKPELMPDQYLSSRVKDVKEVWIKDTIMNVGLGILQPDDWKVVKRVMNDATIHDAVKEMELPILDINEEGMNMTHELPTESFQAGVLAALAQISSYIDDEALTEGDLDPTKFIGPDAQPDFMTHNPKWIGARQDTYIVSKRVQMPEMWGSKRLHVVELRNDAANRLRAMKQYRREQGRGQDLEIAPPTGVLETIQENDEELDDNNAQLAPRVSGVYPVANDDLPQQDLIEEEEDSIAL